MPNFLKESMGLNWNSRGVGGGGVQTKKKKKEKLCGGSMVFLWNNTLKFCKTLSVIQLMFTLL